MFFSDSKWPYQRKSTFFKNFNKFFNFEDFFIKFYQKVENKVLIIIKYFIYLLFYVLPVFTCAHLFFMISIVSIFFLESPGKKFEIIIFA
jgi:hypothetical protein